MFYLLWQSGLRKGEVEELRLEIAFQIRGLLNRQRSTQNELQIEGIARDEWIPPSLSPALVGAEVV